MISVSSLSGHSTNKILSSEKSFVNWSDKDCLWQYIARHLCQKNSSKISLFRFWKFSRQAILGKCNSIIFCENERHFLFVQDYSDNSDNEAWNIHCPYLEGKSRSMDSQIHLDLLNPSKFFWILWIFFDSLESWLRKKSGGSKRI